MDGLPLALVAAGTYMSNIAIDCGEYLQRHKESWQALQQRTPQVPYYNGNVSSCWALTFKELTEDKDVLCALVCWALLDSQDVWFELLDPDGLSWPRDNVTGFDTATRLLFQYGIIELGTDPGDEHIGSRGYNMQRSFHAWLQTRYCDLVRYKSMGVIAVSALTISSCNLIKSGEYHKGLLRLLPHASVCSDLIIRERVHASVGSIIHLATLFEYAGYGRSRNFSRYLAMMQMDSPTKVHLKTSEMLLQHTLRKIEQGFALGPESDEDDNIPHRHNAYRSKVEALNSLRRVYLYMSEFSKVRGITSQLFTIHSDADNETEARLEQEGLRNQHSAENMVRIYLWTSFTMGALALLYVIRCILFLEDGIIFVWTSVLGLCGWASWTVFMTTRRYRRRALAALVLSMVVMCYKFRKFGLLGILGAALPFLPMLISTIPVLCYETLPPRRG
ncbi:uncharacterized protein N7506_007470 [Penicillium brevicompactum]|uniref:uncharacterized protein n=1 Tax=Penicillium brevicompactum TaxID=5074 RepID=UPI0025416A03|nr:uncharacterized protein N7506_007470 [Penicillium brevicompactum]KAJ5333687.1 hypothetical protein N7506_007470 [Penicillium brevicompactum]